MATPPPRLIDRPGLLTTKSEISEPQQLYTKDEGEWEDGATERERREDMTIRNKTV